MTAMPLVRPAAAQRVDAAFVAGAYQALSGAEVVTEAAGCVTNSPCDGSIETNVARAWRPAIGLLVTVRWPSGLGLETSVTFVDVLERVHGDIEPPHNQQYPLVFASARATAAFTPLAGVIATLGLGPSLAMTGGTRPVEPSGRWHVAPGAWIGVALHAGLDFAATPRISLAARVTDHVYRATYRMYYGRYDWVSFRTHHDAVWSMAVAWAVRP